MVNADKQYIEYNLLDSYILQISITFNNLLRIVCGYYEL